MTDVPEIAALSMNAERAIVVDASVACKWFLPEAHSEQAARVLASGRVLLAPDLIFAEVGNVLWKRMRIGDLTAAEADATMRAFGGVALHIHPAWPLVLAAMEIAGRTGRTVYDSLYVALAVRENAVMVTGDERLVSALRGGPLASFSMWVADF